MSRLGPALIVVSTWSRGLADPLRRAALVAAVVAALGERGHATVETLESTGPAQVEAAVRGGLEAGATLVVAIGGDGTVRQAAAALSGSGVPIGIVPRGTGNLLASSLGLPRSTAGALDVLRRGHPRAIDHGLATWAAGAGGAAGSGPFVVACGAGLDARLVASASQESKRRFGIAAYMGAAMASVADLRPRPTRVVVDGRPHETRSVVVLVANAGELVPGLLRPRSPVVPDDGLLDVFVVHGGIVGSIHGTLELLAAGGPGIGRAGLRLQGREVRVEVAPPEPAQLDGDVVGVSPLEARVVPGALHVLVGASGR
jgi:diacylglycerol kinase (ATP)